MRSWRNWQTRKTKDLVVHTMQVQFLSTAPDQNNTNQEDDSRFVLFFARDFFGAIVRLDQHL